MSRRSDVERIIRAAVTRGWRHERTQGSHHRLSWPGGTVLVTAGTPGDFRAVRNLKAALRRAERDPRPGRPPP